MAPRRVISKGMPISQAVLAAAANDGVSKAGNARHSSGTFAGKPADQVSSARKCSVV
jgi:hypothetical protein